MLKHSNNINLSIPTRGEMKGGLRHLTFRSPTLFFTLLSLLSFWLLSTSYAQEYNFTLDQQQAVCQVLNFSFVDCFSYWEDYDNRSFYMTFYNNYSTYNFSNQTVFNCSNSTVYQNITCSNNTFSDLLRIDEYMKRGFEPVFEQGLITNFKKIENCSSSIPTDLLPKSQCEEEKLQQFQIGKNSACESVPEKKSDFNNYLWLLLLVPVVGYFLYNKVSVKKYSAPQQVSPPMTLPELPYSPEVLVQDKPKTEFQI